MNEIVVGLLLGASWIVCAVIGFRCGQEQAHTDEALARIDRALPAAAQPTDGRTGA